MGMTSMNISLPEELKKYVEKKSRSGYSTPSEFVRELIRQDQKRQAKEGLNALLREGLESGAPIKGDARFWAELRRGALAKLGKHKKSKGK